MPRFPLHDLSDTEFEQLVVLVCRELMGIGITAFAPGPDGGKDAKFEGTATNFPSTAAPASGKFIVQAKHTASPVASCSDYDFETTLIDREMPKVKRQFDEGCLTHYLIFTNRRKTGGAEDRIPDRIKAATGVQHIWLRGLPKGPTPNLSDSHRSPNQAMMDEMRGEVPFRVVFATVIQPVAFALQIQPVVQ